MVYTGIVQGIATAKCDLKSSKLSVKLPGFYKGCELGDLDYNIL